LILNSITGEEVFVTASALDEDDASKLDIVLDRDLTLGDNYDFTIISIVDAQGRNIESGIDAITNFQVPSVFETKNPQPVITAVENTVTESLPTESGPIESQTEVQVEPSSKEGETTGGNSVTLVSTDDIEKNVEVTAKKTEELPQTGAEHILLLILALILGFGVFTYFGPRKNS
jgi:LPXTG-motif cell wall-anchored protein